jgi:hypothetical protein
VDQITHPTLNIGTPVLRQGKVTAVLPGTLIVSLPGCEVQACDVLETGAAIPIAEGDVVLIWIPSVGEGRGVVLGRIGVPLSAVASDGADELVIEAKKNLTLKCGDGSITIRADGKILIKGKDLVSHAQRTNRIKGGSVSIN